MLIINSLSAQNKADWAVFSRVNPNNGCRMTANAKGGWLQDTLQKKETEKSSGSR